ncbi:FdtA/QdtA family cupin domain-containing protein [Paenibacillus campi]|uniref:sugar 3,4-ketoisomerase n=1 Tax=Paenibacillus campi TaxID=3106031 RepID=UPI002AFF1825|nr:FdtA/QdtA family cupin domain-containing protein [Paenibacillus sp. SGZ-1009]
MENDSVINFDSHLIEIKQLGDQRGSLAVLQEMDIVPFPIKRVFYIYGTAEGIRRGFHAHYKTRQILISVSGKCKVHLDNTKRTQEVELDSPTKALLLAPNDWHEMYDFSADCVLLVLASELYQAEDYIRDYDEFIKVYS